MAALNSTVASVLVREYVFANASKGKRGEGGGEADSNVLGAYGRDVLKKNGILLRGFAEDNKVALLNTFLTRQKWRVLHRLKRQPQQGTSTSGLYPEKSGGPPIGPLR